MILLCIFVVTIVSSCGVDSPVNVDELSGRIFGRWMGPGMWGEERHWYFLLIEEKEKTSGSFTFEDSDPLISGTWKIRSFSVDTDGTERIVMNVSLKAPADIKAPRMWWGGKPKLSFPAGKWHVSVHGDRLLLDWYWHGLPNGHFSLQLIKV